MTNKEVIKFFEKESINSFSFSTELEMKNSININSKYLYLILWSEDNIYSWGTMSGKSNRIRKSSTLNRKLTGKYDRRVDYLMLKKIYGLKKVYLFEFLNPLIKEKELKTIFTQNHCYHGLNGKNRDEISKSIYERFKDTNWFKKIDIDTKNLFDDFFFNVFLGKLKHPENPKRTFYYGDCLEPKFLRTINKEYLEPVIEKVLDVIFY
jgi:hypothetical protein